MLGGGTFRSLAVPPRPFPADDCGGNGQAQRPYAASGGRGHAKQRPSVATAPPSTQTVDAGVVSPATTAMRDHIHLRLKASGSRLAGQLERLLCHPAAAAIAAALFLAAVLHLVATGQAP